MRWKRTVSAVLLALAALLASCAPGETARPSMPPVSVPTATSTPEPLPAQEKPVFTELVFQRDYAGEESNSDAPALDGIVVKLRFVMPQIQNARGNEAWERINEGLAAQGGEWLWKGREYWGTPGLEPGGDYSVVSTYTIERCDELVSIRYERSEALGETSALTVSGALFSMEDGYPVTMEALLGAPIEERIPLLLDALEAHYPNDAYGQDYYRGYFDVNHFYLTEDSLVLLFPVWEGDATSPTSTLERAIPLDELGF